MPIICIANQKGGTGKTTTTMNLCATLAERGKKVLGIDMDPTPSLTRGFGYDTSQFDLTIYDLFKTKNMQIDKAIFPVEHVPGLSLVAGTELMAAMEIEINSYTAREQRLKKILEPATQFFDYILIDSPPQLSTLTINALTAAEYVLVPCETSRIVYYVLEQLSETIKTVQEDLNANLKVLGTIATMYNVRATEDNQILEALQEHEWDCLGVCRRTVNAKAGIEQGLPVVMTRPESQLAVTYQEITDQIIKITEGSAYNG